jgi:hypothetical protein
MSMVFRSALKPFKAMFRRKASMSRVLLLLDFDHRQRIQFFRAREYAFRVKGGSDLKRSQKAKSYRLYKIILPANTCVIMDGLLYAYKIDEDKAMEYVKRYRIKNWDLIKAGI